MLFLFEFQRMGKKDGGGEVALFNLERINALGGENKRSVGKGTYIP